MAGPGWSAAKRAAAIRMKGVTSQISGWSKRTGEAKSDVVHAKVGGIRRSRRGAQEVEGMEPAAAPDHPVTAVAGRPGRAIAGRSRIIVVCAILGSLPNIAEHVVEPEGIGRKCSDRRCVEPPVPAAGKRGAARL